MRKSSFHDVVVSPEVSIREAMRVIDAGGIGLALVVESDGRLAGTVTDGDVRRAILRGVSLEDPIGGVMNPNPVTSRIGAPRGELIHLMRSRERNFLPIVDGQKRLVGLETLLDIVGQIPLSSPWLAGNEMKYLQEAIESTWVSSSGPFVSRFEEAVTGAVGARCAVATVNGTAALHVALLVAGVEAEDEVLVPDLTFVATANAVVYCGAHPVFLDVDRATWNLDPEKLRDFLEKECTARDGRLVNRSTGRRIKAALPVHLLGHPADMDPILEVCRRFDLVVVEDACQALGALYKGRPVGRLADVACLSFNGNKVVTAGGGGMFVSDDEGLADRARHLTSQARKPGKEYDHDGVGYNYRLTNVCAAIGLAQMECLTEFLDRKRRIAAHYAEAFGGLSGLTAMPAAGWAAPSAWLYTVLVETGKEGPAARLVDHLSQRGIESRRLWKPLHRLPMYARETAYRLEVAPALYERAVSLPSSVHLGESDQAMVVNTVRQWLHSEGP